MSDQAHAYADSLGSSAPVTDRKAQRKRITRHISRAQAKNLFEALSFAETIGYKLNVAIDIAWLMFSGTANDRTRLSRCQERLSKWFARRGFELTMIWVREIGKHGAPHVHILVHVPPWLMDTGEFQSTLDSSLEPEGGPNHEKAILIRHAYAPEGKLRYNLKGLSRRDAENLISAKRAFRVRLRASGLDVRRTSVGGLGKGHYWVSKLDALLWIAKYRRRIDAAKQND